LVYEVGLSLAETNIDWTVLSSLNRQILDPKVDRYFFIEDPVKIQIKNAPEQTVKLKLHPDFEERGFREIKTNEFFYVEKNDYNKFTEGSLIRLMDCLNFIKKDDEFIFHSLDYQKFRENGDKIIHWLAADETVEVSIRMPDNRVIKGIGESNIKNLKQGDIIQFARFGFCRLDNIDDNKYEFWFTHK
ncbi:hypothetical protein GF327_07420, partial [Candidatus Woesearchaeota archaeon]|nr:hypothetical protein [Candidatus Woesearchaeota archaeon]